MRVVKAVGRAVTMAVLGSPGWDFGRPSESSPEWLMNGQVASSSHPKLTTNPRHEDRDQPGTPSPVDVARSRGVSRCLRIGAEDASA